MNKYQIGDIIYGLLRESKGFATCGNRTIQTKKEDMYMYLGKVVYGEIIYNTVFYHFPSGGLIPFSSEINISYYYDERNQK